jgi:hypothetical protein
MKSTDPRSHRITPKEHRELSESIADMRPELRAAIFGAIGPAVHELPAKLSDVGDDLERAALLVPTEPIGHFRALLHSDGYRIVYAGPIAFVGPELDEAVTAAHEARVTDRPAHLRAKPWIRLGPDMWPNLRRTMAALEIKERGESSLPTQALAGSLAPVGPVQLVSLSAALTNMVATVVRAEPVLGIAWLREEEERRRSREPGGVHFGGASGSPVENLLRSTITDALASTGVTLVTFEARHEALIARVVAMATAAPSPLLPLDAPALDETPAEAVQP